jgi:activator of HSP90 ATPase
MTVAPSSDRDRSLTSLHQEVALNASPARIYDVLLDSREFAAFSGLPASIDGSAGGRFSMFGGRIVGRNVELVPDRLIVQAWRPADWSPGVYSIVKFELKPQGSGTLVVLDHTGFPPGDCDHLELGWKQHYWERLQKYLGSHNG